MKAFFLILSLLLSVIAKAEDKGKTLVFFSKSEAAEKEAGNTNLILHNSSRTNLYSLRTGEPLKLTVRGRQVKNGSRSVEECQISQKLAAEQGYTLSELQVLISTKTVIFSCSTSAVSIIASTSALPNHPLHCT